MSKPRLFDVAVLGAGIVGCATARELARRGAKVVILEKNEVPLGEASAGNSGISHTGFDAKPGTLEARLIRRGGELWRELREAVALPEKRHGGLLVAWSKEEAAMLPSIHERAALNGVRTTLLTAREVYAHEAGLAAGAEAGLFVPGEGVLEPWLVGAFYLRSAQARGARLRCRFEVATARLEAHGVWRLESAQGEAVHAALAVNCAGNHGDVLSSILGLLPTFTVTPRKGQFVVFRPRTLHRLRHVVLPVPTERTKGVLLFPTLSGHVVCGPTAEDTADRTSPPPVDPLVTQALARTAERLMPELGAAPIALSYAGLRPATEHADYQLAVDVARRAVTLGGIRSTGLSAALAIAEHAADLIAQHWPFVSAKPPRLDAHAERHAFRALTKDLAKSESAAPPHPLAALNLRAARL